MKHIKVFETYINEENLQFMYSLDGKTIEGPAGLREIFDKIKVIGKPIMGTFTMSDIRSGEPHMLLVHARKATNKVFIGGSLDPDDLNPSLYDQWGNKK